jgi:hypothetical protein
MTVGPELLLIAAVAVVGVLHTVVPDHADRTPAGL